MEQTAARFSTHKTAVSETAESADGVVVHPAPIPPSAVVMQAPRATAVTLVRAEKTQTKKYVKKSHDAPFG